MFLKLKLTIFWYMLVCVTTVVTVFKSFFVCFVDLLHYHQVWMTSVDDMGRYVC